MTRPSDSSYRVFADALPDAAFVVDLASGRIEWANEAAARLHGTTREKLVGLAVAMVSAEAGPTGPRMKRLDGRPDFPVEVNTREVEWEGRRWLVGVARDATARERVLRELQDSKALLESAFRASPLLVAVSELKTARYTEVNDAFCRELGLSRDEVVGRSSLELGVVGFEVRDQLIEVLMRDGRVSGLELPLKSSSGSPRTGRFFCDVVETPQGPQAVTMVEDVTERRKVESARIEAERRLEKLAERVPGAMFQCRVTPDGALSLPYATAHLATLFEMDPAELLPEPSRSFTRYHPDDLSRVKEGIEVAARDLTLMQFEVRAVLPSGTKWLHCSAVPEREPDGSVLLNGFITDVTARKQAEAELATSEQRFQLAMEATSDALFDWNLATGTAFTTPHYVRMLGFEPGEWVPTVESWQERLHPDDVTRVWGPIEDCVAGKRERYEVEYRLRGKDGRWHWVLSRGKGLDRDEQGRARRLVGTQLDLGAQKRLELELAQRDRLANLGLLAAGIAHEVNNPLSWVLANLSEMTDLLGRMTGVTARVLEELGDDAAAVLGDEAELGTPRGLTELVSTAESALEGTQRIRQLSRSLGAFARAGEAELESVDVNEALETAARMAANELKFRARLERALQPVPSVRAVSGKVIQLFLNLLVHAARSIPEGHADAHRITLRSWAEGTFVFVEVSDTAQALTPEQTVHLFEPRFSATHREGLGLAIVRNLVTEFGGDVRVESAHGRGTRVVVRLPGEKPVGYPPSAMTEAGRGRVLVVDDEPALRRTLARTLRDYDVETAASAREVQELLQTGKDFDVVLCDVSMPEMSGPELHRWMQERHPALAARLVFLSGGSFSPDINDALEKSGARRLDKPFEAAKLKALVDEFVAARRG